MRDNAIKTTHPTVTTINAGIDAWDKDGNIVVLDESKITTEMARLQAEYDALEYARNRQAEYPDWGDQLNKIYDDGVTKWKSEMVDPIKAKYPKPS
jgi:hypothetical protein